MRGESGVFREKERKGPKGVERESRERERKREKEREREEGVFR